MIRKEYNSERFEFPFAAYLPENVCGSLPLIVQLHGAGEVGKGGDELYKVDVNGLSKLFAKEDFPCILVMPQCPPDSFWVAQLQNIRTFIEKLKSEFEIDENKIYLTGLSMGGYGTWYTSLAFPDMFAAIAPVCGGGMVWKAPVLQMPVWAFHGSEDETVYPAESINMIHAVRKHSSNDVRFTMFDGVGHNSWEGAYTRELVEWLLSKSKL